MRLKQGPGSRSARNVVKEEWEVNDQAARLAAEFATMRRSVEAVAKTVGHSVTIKLEMGKQGTLTGKYIWVPGSMEDGEWLIS